MPGLWRVPNHTWCQRLCLSSSRGHHGLKTVHGLSEPAVYHFHFSAYRPLTSYFSTAVTETPEGRENKTSRIEGFTFASWEAWQQDLKMAGHTGSTIRKQRVTNVTVQPAVSFLLSDTPTEVMVPATFRLGLPFSGKPPWKQPHRQTHQ